MKTTLYTELKKYVGHASALARTENYRGKLSFLTPLDQVRMSLKSIQTNNDKAIAAIVIQQQSNLRKILPYPGNKSYESSFVKLNQLIDTAIKTRISNSN